MHEVILRFQAKVNPCSFLINKAAKIINFPVAW